MKSSPLVFSSPHQPLHSRHRAAIGVSEVSDAITIVVSEETGRISIAANGELQMVDQTKFLMTFETYMADSTANKE